MAWRPEVRFILKFIGGWLDDTNIEKEG